MSDILQVAVPTPLWQSFDYLLPDGVLGSTLQPGMRLQVPFGRREVIGILLDVVDQSPLARSQLKAAQTIVDEEPLIPPSLLALYRWASRYYHYPIGEVVVGTLPRLLRQAKTVTLENSNDNSLLTMDSPIELNAEQQTAVTAITQAKKFTTLLLSGVTGSGKTEVYLHCIAEALKQNKQAIVLVPEIGLTPQTVDRFQQRFNVPIAVFHSNLTDKQRAQAWLMAKSGRTKIIIGTRSAIFTPLLNPGIIILDEEHDVSFKQQSGFRYSARDVAVMRGYLDNIPIVLGSATPSLESLANVKRDRYQLLTLSERAGEATLPTMRAIDIRQQPLTSGISERLFAAIKKHLDNNGQVLLFLNRRGFASTLLCHGCGWVMHCERCDARLTLHHSPKRLYCHHCGCSKKIPLSCPECRQCDLVNLGLGTERLEVALQQRFPDQSIVRIDRDSTRRKNSMADKLQQIHDHDAKILVGTQMVAKGHHFSHLSLVAIVDADTGLLSTDFRATEHMGQLMMQVAGRAGREQQRGEVLIQTHCPDNPLLTILMTQGYDAFAKVLLQERQTTQLPPFSHMVMLRAEAVSQELPSQFLQQAKQFIAEQKNKNVMIYGPIPAAMERKAGRFRYQLLLQSATRKELHSALEKLMQFLTTTISERRVRWSLDVDPLEVI